MKRVAITRAAPGASQTAKLVRARGAEPVLAPLLTIEHRPFDTDITGAQALIFTSGHGVSAQWLRNPEQRNVTVLAVGDATAEAARRMGYSGVLSADGDVASLVEQAKHMLDPARGSLIHISGAHVAGNLVAELTAVGFSVERRIAYEAVAASALPEAFASQLDIVLFHSARAAEVFVSLGAPNAGALTAGCFSEAVAEAAGKTAWKRLIVAPAPREEALLAATLGG
jgi:uroporphyrinogen-III synthase